MGERPGGSRRRFLAGVVGGAAAITTGTVAATALHLSTSNHDTGGRIKYRGIRKIGGPADPLPQVPITVDDDGYLHGVWPDETENGVPTTTIAGVTYSADWFRYCNFEDHAGFRADADEDTSLRSAADPPYDWQTDATNHGDRLHTSDFDDYETWGNDIGTAGLGKPAIATWRSQNANRPFFVQVMRSERVSEMQEDGEWLHATTDDDFIAWVSHCTHWCAVTAFKAYEDSENFGGEDLVYCPKHQSVFDPFDIVTGIVNVPPWESTENKS